MSANHYAFAGFANAMACHARVLGMQAENKLRESCGESPAYGEAAFNAEAALLDNIAREILTNGWS